VVVGHNDRDRAGRTFDHASHDREGQVVREASGGHEARL
jgi:hypothetical protein